jgi:hypothetical protein
MPLTAMVQPRPAGRTPSPGRANTLTRQGEKLYHEGHGDSGRTMR